MAEPQEAVIRCVACRSVLVRQSAIPVPEGYHGDAYIEIYQCPGDGCRRKAVLMWELARGATDEAQGWVEREIRARGAFFPSDFT